MNKESNKAVDLDDLDVLADEALRRALLLPPGIERHDALKLASRLRCAADLKKPVRVKNSGPEKNPLSGYDNSNVDRK
jgi:hypothetical protein